MKTLLTLGTLCLVATSAGCSGGSGSASGSVVEPTGTFIEPGAAPTSTVATPAPSSGAPVPTSTPTSVPVNSPAAPSTTECASARALGVRYDSIDGVTPNLLSLDVYPVAGRCDAPVAIWVHGGGWRRGDKQNGAEQRAAFYNSQGWVLVAVNYRLTDPEVDPPVQYPDHNNDVAAAIAWVHDEIAAYGGDPEATLLVGHSAGASIVASVIADPDHLGAHSITPDWLDCAVSLDTAGYDITRAAQARSGSAIYLNAFGTDPAVWADASPVNHIGEGPLPGRTLIVTRGGEQRLADAEEFAALLADAGVAADTFDANPLTHMEVNDEIGVAGSTMTSLMTTELAACSTDRTASSS